MKLFAVADLEGFSGAPPFSEKNLVGYIGNH